MERADKTKPLAGMRVIDLSRYANGLCVRIARCLGASIEWYSIRQLDDQVACATIHDTIRQSAILIEDNEPGYLDQFNLGFNKVREMQPSIVYLSVTDCGLIGPKAGWKTDPCILASMSGQAALCGALENAPVTPPDVTVNAPAQLFALFALMIQHMASQSRAEAIHIDISRLESAAAVNDRSLVATLNGLPPPERGNADGSYGYFRCKNGWVMVYLGRYLERISEWIKAESSSALRLSSGKEINRQQDQHVIGSWLQKKNSDVVFGDSQMLRMPWAYVSRTVEQLNNPQHSARGFGRNRMLPWKNYHTRAMHGYTNIVNKDTGPLTGLRILDFSWVLAGPYASRLLADAGAEVIKVQSRSVAGTLDDVNMPYYQTWNRNKKSITLNLSDQKGVKLASRLFGKCDAVIDSFSPRVMPNWGLRPIEICCAHPGLIWLSMSSFGATGPWRDYVAFAQTNQSLSGLTNLCCDRRGYPQGIGFAFADHISGIMGSIALLGAIEARRHTRRGQWIDFSQFEALCMLFANNDKGIKKDSIKNYIFPCMGFDRWCAVSLKNVDERSKFLNVMEIPQSNSGKHQTQWKENGQLGSSLEDLIAERTRNWDRQHLVEYLQNHDIAAGPVNNSSDVMEDEQFQARGCFPFINGRIYDNLPAGLCGSDVGEMRPAPVLGQDNDYVFKVLLGMKDREIQALIDSKVIW
jgi:crotonobetainyl-CoA:carnitine CoA-transferase CaiB-like acyl-CoA transferase